MKPLIGANRHGQLRVLINEELHRLIVLSSDFKAKLRDQLGKDLMHSRLVLSHSDPRCEARVWIVRGHNVERLVSGLIASAEEFLATMILPLLPAYMELMEKVHNLGLLVNVHDLLFFEGEKQFGLWAEDKVWQSFGQVSPADCQSLETYTSRAKHRETQKGTHCRKLAHAYNWNRAGQPLKIISNICSGSDCVSGVYCIEQLKCRCRTIKMYLTIRMYGIC